MSEGPKNKPSGYDKYINYKTFALAAGLFIVLLVLPVPSSMLDVAVEFSVGRSHVRNFYTQELFGKKYNDAEQWEVLSIDTNRVSSAKAA